MILEILQYPHKNLRKIAEPVYVFNKSIQELVDNMLETMHAAKGIGLAATQVDIHKQVIVIDISEDQNDCLVFINAKVTPITSELAPYREGCLSIPGFYDEVLRPSKVQIEYQDIRGAKHSIQANNLLAVCIQHEVDHLNGKLFIDYLSKLKVNRLNVKLKKQLRN